MNFDLPGSSGAPFLQVLAGTRQIAGAYHLTACAANWWKQLYMLPCRKMQIKTKSRNIYIHKYFDRCSQKRNILNLDRYLNVFLHKTWKMFEDSWLSLGMDLRKGSKSLSCETLAAGAKFMEKQPQPKGGPPPVEAWLLQLLFSTCFLISFFSFR